MESTPLQLSIKSPYMDYNLFSNNNNNNKPQTRKSNSVPRWGKTYTKKCHFNRTQYSIKTGNKTKYF